jgi:allantoinase
MSRLANSIENIAKGGNIIVRGERVITPEGERAAAIHVKNGLIAKISEFSDVTEGCAIFEAHELPVLPGLVDTHVHINEPGRTDWEGFATATRAAAAGGVTTLIEMPLNSIPATTSLSAFQTKMKTTEGKLSVDVGFWGGVVPGNTNELRALWEAGCFGFKCFLIESGVDEFGWVAESHLREALPELVKFSAPLLAHAELPGPIQKAETARSSADSPRQYATWLQSRRAAAENEAVELLIKLSKEFEANIHIVHLSSADKVPALKQVKDFGGHISVETCPHYLTFVAEDIREGETEFKCAPPIRERENREKLWAAMRDGTIDLIATDHSPCPPEMKRMQDGDFLRAWGGIASLQLSLPAVWTEASSRGYSLNHIARWMSAAPARLSGLQNRKGAIAKGCDADLVIFDPEARFLVKGENLEHRHKLTPYEGRELRGKAKTTFLRGVKIFENEMFGSSPLGRVLLRGRT